MCIQTHTHLPEQALELFIATDLSRHKEFSKLFPRKIIFSFFFTEFKIQLLGTNGPYRKVTPNRKTHSKAAVNPAEEKRALGCLFGKLATQMYIFN